MPLFTDVSCMFSTVKNTSGKTMRFGFLPPHGRQLEDDEEITVFGNIYDRVAHANGGDANMSRRHMIAFEGAIERGDLTVLQTPAPILVDATSGHSKMLALDGGVLGILDPCWENADISEDFVPE